MQKLAQQNCQQKVELLDSKAANSQLAGLEKCWSVDTQALTLLADFSFRSFEQTMFFVNAIADIASQQNHHPQISFGYAKCSIAYSTHSVSGLSINDFICAAKIDSIKKT